MSESHLLRFNPFEGERDVQVRCRTVRMLTTRKAHLCFDPSTGKPHEIPAGTRARYETAIVDGEWGSFYCCVACIEKWLKDFGMNS